MEVPFSEEHTARRCRRSRALENEHSKAALILYFLLGDTRPRVERSINLGEAALQRRTAPASALSTPRPSTIGPPLTTCSPRCYLFPGEDMREIERGRKCVRSKTKEPRKQGQTLKHRETIPASPRCCPAALERNKKGYRGAFSRLRTSI